MCDNQGISGEKVKVFSIVDSNISPSSIIFDNVETVVEYIKAEIENMDESDPEQEFKVSIKMMNKSELEKLKEIEF